MSVIPADRASPKGLMGERAYVELRDRLITLRIPPGCPVHEEGFAREIGVGRTPVREAIRRLALESLVVVHPRQGTFASDIHITDLGHLVHVREPLEARAAALAAARISAVQREELAALLAELGALGIDEGSARMMGLDAEVHRFVYRCADNPYLQDTLERYFNLSMRIWHLVLDRLPKLEEHIDEHRLLLEAIERGDEKRAAKVAGDHVTTFARRFRAAL